MIDTGLASPEVHEKKEVKKDPKEEYFKNYEFISKQQARYLLEILKQPVYFNSLPVEGQNIVKGV